MPVWVRQVLQPGSDPVSRCGVLTIGPCVKNLSETLTGRNEDRASFSREISTRRFSDLSLCLPPSASWFPRLRTITMHFSFTVLSLLIATATATVLPSRTSVTRNLLTGDELSAPLDLVSIVDDTVPPPVPAAAVLTNAERFALGLPPATPRRLGGKRATGE
jgi:hypothetical protein